MKNRGYIGSNDQIQTTLNTSTLGSRTNVPVTMHTHTHHMAMTTMSYQDRVSGEARGAN